ncbi:hypothetical protein [Actibacterium mucosum]|uniref:hypothetical protein n=1 Tax=Actibacterium mucosum TaxID=1087332 RepID=UPI0013785B90|nr:hypothetical protein [Actibacterium mucosum]
MKVEYLLILLLGLAAVTYFARTAITFRDFAQEKESVYEQTVLDLKDAVAGQ